MTAHIADDPSLYFVDWSRRGAAQYASQYSADIIAAQASWSERDRLFDTYRRACVKERMDFEAANPGVRFPGCFLHSATPPLDIPS